jgi:hypothetical protein
VGRYFNNAGAPGEHVLDTRWGMVCLYGIFIAGETLNDPSLIDLSVYGPGGSNDNVTGGFMDCFKPNFLHEGALWGAGSSIDDQISSLSVMTTVAELMWHRGVNLYAYKDAVVKQSFDAALKSIWRSASTCRRRLCQRQLRNKARGAEAGTAPLRSLSR